MDLAVDGRFSGPPPGEPNPLVDGRADLAFVCAPSYLGLAHEVRFVPVAPLFADGRAPGAPVYFAECSPEPATHGRRSKSWWRERLHSTTRCRSRAGGRS
jgi:hypothetical protein